MIYVDFPGDVAVPAETPATFGASIFDFAVDWMAENSYGLTTLDLSYDDQWLRMSKPATDYGFASGGLTFAEQREYMREAIVLADAAGFNFAGRPTVFVVAAPTGGDIPQSAALNAGVQDAINVDGTQVRFGGTSGDDVRVPTNGFGPKVMAHETGHTFGLPDLYHFGDPFHRHVGAWDLMGDLAPGLHTLAWHKLKLGWLAASQWLCVGNETSEAVITPSAVSDGGVKMLATAISPSVAYAAEVRTPVNLDMGMCDAGGVLVYRIDANVGNGQGPIVVQPDEVGEFGICGPLAHAPFDLGETFTAEGVTVQVVASEGGGLRVRMTSPGRTASTGDPGGGGTGGGGTGGSDTNPTQDPTTETRCTVPKIAKGSRLTAVKKALTEADCDAGKVTRKRSKLIKRGRLIRLKSKPGTVLAAGAAVDIVLSAGKR